MKMDSKKRKLINDAELDELKNNLIGKKIKLVNVIPSDEIIEDTNLYITQSMSQMAGQVVTINTIESNGKNYFFRIREYEYTWDFALIDFILDNEKEEVQEIQEEQEVHIGDLVKIKKNEDELEQIGEYLGIPIKRGKINNIDKDIQGKEIIIQDIKDNIIYPYYLDDKYENAVIYSNQVTVIKKNYIQEIENKERKTKKEMQILDDFNIMQEMKNKVNIKDFKKIYAGSLKLIPNELKGVELLLHQWAFNKKHIYRMFENNFSIQKELEFVKDEQLIGQDKRNLIKKFPGTYYIIEQLLNTEFANNRLTRIIDNYEYDWVEYSRKFNKGEKVSKLLKELFDNEKLNIEYSNVVAHNKIKGTIEISIDPIEILLMSCNNSDWTSCHRIYKMGRDDISYGEYSAGIFSYMCDSTSMIAFRHDGKLYDYKITNQKIQAHSKNWRQMIWLEDDFKSFVCSRQYPNKLDEVAKQVRELLEEQINKYFEEKTWVHSTKKEKIQKLIIDNKKNDEITIPLHYNDMLHNFNGDLCYIKNLRLDNKKIEVGSYPVCPKCGKYLLTRHSIPICEKCSDFDF